MTATRPAKFHIRQETADDIDTIAELTARAFEGHPHADGSEPQIIERLREQHVLTVSMVAEIEGKILGHIAFSPAANSNGSAGWYALGPISVSPTCQRQGIGSTLVEAGMTQLKALGASGCILLGDPDYYCRFGFRVTPECCAPNLPGEYFMTATFNEAPTGVFSFHPAFFGPVSTS